MSERERKRPLKANGAKARTRKENITRVMMILINIIDSYDDALLLKLGKILIIMMLIDGKTIITILIIIIT